MPEKENPQAIQKNLCAETQPALRIAPEQLRLWLNDRRNRAQETRRQLLEMAARLEKEITAYDELLADLTTG